MERRMGERQRWAWLAAGWSILSAACLCSYHWLWVLLGGLLAALYYLYIDRVLPPEGLAQLYRDRGKPGAVLMILSFCWLILLMAWTTKTMELAYPKAERTNLLGWVLLALAAWGSIRGSAACAACSGVLCLVLLVLYGILACFAIPDVQWHYLMPTLQWQQGLWSLGLCLLPGAIWFLPSSSTRKLPCRNLCLLLPIGSAVLAAWTAGVLSPKLAAIRPVPLYDLAQSISVLGVVERIEPLLSAAMTMGLFSLLSILACACQELGGRLRPMPYYGAAACLGAAVVLGRISNFQTPYIVAGTAFFIVILPFMTAKIGNKKSENPEK